MDGNCNSLPHIFRFISTVSVIPAPLGPQGNDKAIIIQQLLWGMALKAGLIFFKVTDFITQIIHLDLAGFGRVNGVDFDTGQGNCHLLAEKGTADTKRVRGSLPFHYRIGKPLRPAYVHSTSSEMFRHQASQR